MHVVAMKMTVAKPLVQLGLILLAIQGLKSQELIFENGIQHNQGGLGNWTAQGKISMTEQDMIIFEPVVSIQAVTQFCSIDLRSCAPDKQLSETHKACYCSRRSDASYDLFVKGHSNLSLDDMTVQAAVPSRYLFSPMSMTSELGHIRTTLQLSKNEDDSAGFPPTNDRLQELENTLNNERRKSEVTKQKLSVCEVQNTALSKPLIDTKADLDTSKEAQKKTTDRLKELEMRMSAKMETLTKMLEDFTHKADGMRQSALPHTCHDVQSSTSRPVVTLSSGLEVVCDTVTDGGGWVVLQRRASKDVDFYRDWEDYKYGFGDLFGNFWFGLEKMHGLAFQRRYELRIDLTFNGTDYYARYDNFTLLGEPELYKMFVSGYSGNAGDSLRPRHDGIPFSTKDRDNDCQSTQHCAQLYHGGWWYIYGTCHAVNLNGKWASTAYGDGLNWDLITGWYASVSFSEIKMRPLRS